MHAYVAVMPVYIATWLSFATFKNPSQIGGQIHYATTREIRMQARAASHDS